MFTLKTDASGEDYDKDQDFYFYCLCVIQPTLLRINFNGKPKLLISERAYCVMSTQRCFDFHLQVLNSVVGIIRMRNY